MVSPPAASADTPAQLEKAVSRIGTEMGATIFEVIPRTTRERFLAALALLMEEEFGEPQEQQGATARVTLLAQATAEFVRLGGVFEGEAPRRRSGK